MMTAPERTTITTTHIDGIEGVMESSEFAAIAAEEGVDVATARRLVRAALKLGPSNKEDTLEPHQYVDDSQP